MGTTFLLFVAVCAAVLQALWPPWSVMGHSKPPIIMAVVLYTAMTKRWPVAGLTACFAGLMQDALGLMPLGLSSIAFLFFAGILNRYRQELFIDHGVTQWVCGGLGHMTVSLMVFLMLSFAGLIDRSVITLLLRLMGAFIQGGVTMLLVSHLMSTMEGKLGLSARGVG